MLDATPASMRGKDLGSPDEVRSFEKGRMDVVDLGDDVVVGRAVFEPGWRWSEHVKPIAGTDSCQVAHVGYVTSPGACASGWTTAPSGRSARGPR